MTAVGPGENVKIKLKGVEEEDISSGFVLCDPNNTCKTGRIFDAQVHTFVILRKTGENYIPPLFLGSNSGTQEYHLCGLLGCMSHTYSS